MTRQDRTPRRASTYFILGTNCDRPMRSTNAIESLNYQLRKIIENRGDSPNDQAAVKLLWLAICNIEDKRARERQKFYDDPLKTGDRSRNKRLVEGARTHGWKQALGALAVTYPERIKPYL
ncbi:transposase [Mycobacterium sp. 29Ha]|uniref:transposase n=1 Tax=Mycobacterium sp. 29Ha TaxID=2939268 RepID=UPI0029393C51|nr:transposase [Mycobacterium sp. 29Ha]